ncbi:unnamed protein product [Ilex paraguariensis]|uniref:Uncharacterized protein n=1 Tax=Ilex paraguariensis TaxID=185542 RepID=A0ABC8QMA3_9AQUA
MSGSLGWVIWVDRLFKRLCSVLCSVFFVQQISPILGSTVLVAASLSEESSIMDLVVTLHLKAMVENMELVSPAHMEATVADTEMVVAVHKEEDIEGMVVGVVPAAVDDDEWVGDDGERVVACHKEGIVMVVGIGTAVDGHK